MHAFQACAATIPAAAASEFYDGLVRAVEEDDPKVLEIEAFALRDACKAVTHSA